MTDAVIRELEQRVVRAYTMWLVHGRGLEGMGEIDILAGVSRYPPARYVALFLLDPEIAHEVLRSGFFDPGTGDAGNQG